MNKIALGLLLLLNTVVVAQTAADVESLALSHFAIEDFTRDEIIGAGQVAEREFFEVIKAHAEFTLPVRRALLIHFYVLALRETLTDKYLQIIKEMLLNRQNRYLPKKQWEALQQRLQEVGQFTSEEAMAAYTVTYRRVIINFAAALGSGTANDLAMTIELSIAEIFRDFIFRLKLVKESIK